jgi:HlyD family secretion protein
VKKRIVILVVLGLLLGTGLLVYRGQQQARTGELFYSGTIEATQARLSFQAGGRVLSVPVREGQAVARGQLLAELDPAEFLARQNQAKANLDKAQRTREQAQALLRLYERTLPAEVARAEAGLGVMRAQLAEVRAGSRSQEIERARQAMAAAAAVLADAQKNLARYETLFGKGVVSEKERDAVRLRHETALRDHERSREAHDLAREGSRPETVRTAEVRLTEGEALLRQAKSSLVRIEAAQREVEAARAAAAAAAAALDQATIQLAYARVTAPLDGIVTSRSIEPGEVVTPGREIMTLSNLAAIDLKIFVEETQIGKVKPGQKVEVRVDTFPDRVFPGTVAFISPEAEFTPKIIQTQKERVKLVYLVKVAIPNPGLELKSGMPADAWLR